MDNYKVPLAIAGGALAVAAVGVALSVALTTPGPEGERGDGGPVGPSFGPTGPKGVQGQKGTQGPEGFQGAALAGRGGPTGPTGTRGADATQTSKGDDGENGFSGPQGEPGPSAPAASTLRTRTFPDAPTPRPIGIVTSGYTNGEGVLKRAAPYDIYVTQRISIPDTWVVLRVTCVLGAVEYDSGYYQSQIYFGGTCALFFYRVSRSVGGTARTLEVVYPTHLSPILLTEKQEDQNFGSQESAGRNASTLANPLVSISSYSDPNTSVTSRTIAADVKVYYVESTRAA